MVSCKSVVILWIACSTTWVQAHASVDLLTGYRPNHDDPSSWNFHKNFHNHQTSHRSKFPSDLQIGDYTDIWNPYYEYPELFWPTVRPRTSTSLPWYLFDLEVPKVTTPLPKDHTKPHPEVPEVTTPTPEDHTKPHLEVPEVTTPTPEDHTKPRLEVPEVTTPTPEDHTKLHPEVPEVTTPLPEDHTKPHPEVPEVTTPPPEDHLKPYSEASEVTTPLPEDHTKPHPEVPEVTTPPQNGHPDHQPEIHRPGPLAPNPVTTPNSNHLPTEAQPVTPVSNGSPHSAQAFEESSKTEESSSIFYTEPSQFSTLKLTKTKENYLEHEPLSEYLIESISEKSSMETMEVPLIVGTFLGVMITLLIISIVVYVFRRSKSGQEYGKLIA